MIDKIGLGALLLALALAPIIGGYPAGGAYGADVSLNALRALTIVAAVCFAFGRATAEDSRKSSRPAVVSAAAIWAAFALSLLSLLVHSHFLTSPVLLFAQVPATLDWLCFALIFTLCLEASRTLRQGTGWILGAIAVGTAFAAITGAHDYGQSVQAGLRSERISGPFFDPNFLAGFLALSLPIVVALCLAARERLAALGLGVLAALVAGALTATGSRAGLGIAFAGVAITLFLTALTARRGSSSSGAPPIARSALLVFACLALVAIFRGPITARVGAGGAAQEHSGQFRTWTWKGTIAMTKANPLLGTGPGTFPYRYPPYALVEKTGLAHSSYLETAAEQGVPAALAAITGITAAIAAGCASLWKTRSANTDDRLPATARIILCGVIGGLIAGSARSAFDSEWSILGNAIPYWAVAGLAAAGLTTEGSGSGAGAKRVSTAGLRLARGIGLLGALAVALALMQSDQKRDAAQAEVKTHQTPSVGAVWPPDPDMLYWAGDPQAAAVVEPSGRSFYRLARGRERDGDEAEAVEAFRLAAEADPNNLQSWRALAEAQEKAGDATGALASWNELIRRYQSPSGQIRAIPEIPETHPAFAYAAIADGQVRQGDHEAAKTNYRKAAEIVEAYSRTPPLYQQTELMSAQASGVDLAGRRREIRALYERVVDALVSLGGLPPAESAGLKQSEQDTLSRLNTFPDSPGAQAATTTAIPGSDQKTPPSPANGLAN